MSKHSGSHGISASITGLSSSGHGVAVVDVGGSKRVVFVPGGVPGDLVEIDVVEPQDSGAIHASLQRVVSPSKERIKPPCPYFGVCGGCSIQQVSYSRQLKEKTALVVRALAGLGVEIASRVDPAIPARQPLGTRTRGRFHVSVEGPPGAQVRKLGLNAVQTNDVIDIESCIALDPRLDKALKWVRRFWLEEFPDKAQVELVLDEGKDRVVAVAYPPITQGSEVHPLDIELPEDVPPPGIALQTASCQEGASFFPLEGDRPLRFLPGVFTQSDIVQNRVLVREVLKAAKVTSNDRVLDLCCGVGNFSLPLAKRARLVEGIEANRRAIDFASKNAIRWKRQNARFRKADVQRALWLLRSKGKRFEVVIADPPRTGIGSSMEALDDLALKRIVYVSCNPRSCAKDLAFLKTFEVVSIQPIDMFPQTMHIESVIVLEKKKVDPAKTAGRPGASRKPKITMSDL